jgi:hypothetical protein
MAVPSICLFMMENLSWLIGCWWFSGLGLRYSGGQWSPQQGGEGEGYELTFPIPERACLVKRVLVSFLVFVLRYLN